MTTTTTPPSTTTTTAVAPPSAPPSKPHLTSQEAEDYLLGLMNTERRRRDLPLLSGRADVIAIAQRWSRSMADQTRLHHNDDYFRSSTRGRLQARLRGENVAFAPSVDEAHRRLMVSDGHRRNILNARFTIVGVGTVFRDGRWWITQDFLQPQRPAQAPSTRGAGRSTERLAVSPVLFEAANSSRVASPTGQPIPPPEFVDELIPTSQLSELRSAAELPAGLLVFLLWLGPGLWLFARRRGDSVDGEEFLAGQQRESSEDRLTRIAVGHHQLKTKLAVTCGWSMTLVERWASLPETDRKSIVDILARTSREAAAIADHLLLEERAVAAKDEVRLVRVDVHHLLEEFVHHARALAQGRQLRLSNSSREITAMADSSALQMVLEQLVENAAKYSPAGTEIVITADTSNDVVAITISDHGPGFADGLDPFAAGERGDRTTTGNGLGLYMARSLMTAMRGSIEILPGPQGAVRISLESPSRLAMSLAGAPAEC